MTLYEDERKDLEREFAILEVTDSLNATCLNIPATVGRLCD